MPYFVEIKAINAAGTSTTTRSSPVFLDASEPTPGFVVDGLDIQLDEIYHGNQHQISGTLLFLQHTEDNRCLFRNLWKMNSNKHIQRGKNEKCKFVPILQTIRENNVHVTYCFTTFSKMTGENTLPLRIDDNGWSLQYIFFIFLSNWFTLIGTFLHYANPDKDSCPQRSLHFANLNNWKHLQNRGLWNVDGTEFELQYDRDKVF